MSVNPKYLKGLNESQKDKKIKNIKETRKLLKEGKKKEAFELASKRPVKKDGSRTSSFTERFKKKFPDTKPLTKKFAEKTGIPLVAQKEIFRRGKGAFASAGSRSTVSSPEQWAYARTLAFYFKGIDNKLDFDKDLVKKYNIKFKK